MYNSSMTNYDTHTRLFLFTTITNAIDVPWCSPHLPQHSSDSNTDTTISEFAYRTNCKWQCVKPHECDFYGLQQVFERVRTANLTMLKIRIAKRERRIILHNPSRFAYKSIRYRIVHWSADNSHDFVSQRRHGDSEGENSERDTKRRREIPDIGAGLYGRSISSLLFGT